MNETDLDTMFQRITSSVRKQFPMVDRDDIYQECWLKYLSMDATHMNEKMIWSSIRRAAASWCVKEKAQIVGYDVEDLYYYSTAQIRELLPTVLEREAWVQSGVVNDLGKISVGHDPAHGNNRLAMLVDVKASLEAGSEQDKTLLWTAFGLQMPEQEHAESLGITEDALRMRVNRALRRLQNRLGGPRPQEPPSGLRKALSNAAAQHITRSQEAEE